MRLLRRTMLAAGALILLAFLVLEAIVLLGCHDETDRDAPVMILLGAMTRRRRR